MRKGRHTGCFAATGVMKAVQVTVFSDPRFPGSRTVRVTTLMLCRCTWLKIHQFILHSPHSHLQSFATPPPRVAFGDSRWWPCKWLEATATLHQCHWEHLCAYNTRRIIIRASRSASFTASQFCTIANKLYIATYMMKLINLFNQVPEIYPCLSNERGCHIAMAYTKTSVTPLLTWVTTILQ